ncbi:MAG: sigma-70 family RNA polymerase sigma factor [Deltaproteobacteria bacterium]|nr:sigma-70 family RNA polymerase sigma factor [Deltaproteobacteria bacterium]
MTDRPAAKAARAARGVEPYARRRSGAGPAGGGDPSLGAWFRWIHDYPLLTPDQELQLVREIRACEEHEWACLLSFRPLLPRLLRQLLPSLRRPPRALRALDRLTRCRAPAAGSSPAAVRAQRAAAVAAAARRFCVRDRDRRLLDAALHCAWSLGGAPARRRSGGTHRCDTCAGRFLAELGRAVRATRDAKRRMILANLRLVVAVARRYRRPGTPLVDLVQDGHLGLLKAVDRFDPRRGVRFSTYATWWIRHAVRRAVLERERTVRLPVHLTEARRRFRRALDDAGSADALPSDERLAARLGLSPYELKAARLHGTDHTVSLDQAVPGTETARLLDDLTDPEAESPLDQLMGRRTRAEVLRALATLPPREAHVLRLRFGFDGVEERTLREIAECLRLSRERIRQIERQAIERLRRRTTASPR